MTNSHTDLELLALISRPSLNPTQINRVAALLKEVDFDSLFDHICHHRIEGCAYCNMRDYFAELVPKPFLDSLSDRYKRTSSITLNQFRVLNKIKRACKQADIALFVMKGIPLAERFYGDIAKRYSKDIDLLVYPTDMQRAHEILKGMGFNCFVIESFNPHELQIVIKKQKDLTYHYGSIPVELHFQLTQYYSGINALSEFFLNPGTEPDTEIYSINELVYLCSHASSSNYHRLKWLVDIAIILETKGTPVFCRKSLSVARQRGVERSVIVSFMLVSELFSKNNIELANISKMDIFISKYLFKSAIRSLHGIDRFLLFRNNMLNICLNILYTTRLKDKLKVLIWLFRPHSGDLKLISTRFGRHPSLYYLLRPITFLYRRLLALTKSK